MPHFFGHTFGHRFGNKFGHNNLFYPTPVIWTSLVNAQDNGNGEIEKTSGPDSAWNSGGISTRVIDGTGGVNFTNNEYSTNVLCGLSYGNTDEGFADVDFGIYLRGADNLYLVYENLVLKYTSPGVYTLGDVFTVDVVGTTVRYYRNGTLFYTSLSTPTKPLIVDCSIFRLTKKLTANIYGGA